MDRTQLSALLTRVALGDRAAFSQVYDATSGKLHATALLIVRDRSEAEEAVQDAFINVWRRAKSFDPDRASAMTWLIAIARNAAIDRARRLRPTRPMDELPEREDEDTPSPELSALASDEARAVRACLDGLGGQESDLVRAAFMGGLSYSEIAEAKSKPLGTVKSTIRRALSKLRHCLERGGATSTGGRAGP